jgi:hypothetical protein
MRMIPILMAVALACSGCSKANGGAGPSAERVYTSQPGFVCFLIRDETGKGVGGGCANEN